MNEDDKTCEQLSAYMDGELGADESKGLERAIQSDPKLAAELAQLRATRELVRRADRVAAPEGFVDSVLQQAERQCLVASAPIRGRSPALRWLRFAAAAAALAIAVCAAMIIWHALPLPDEAPEINAHSGEDRGGGRGEPSASPVEDIPRDEERRELDFGPAGKERGTDAQNGLEDSIQADFDGSGKGTISGYRHGKKNGTDMPGGSPRRRSGRLPTDGLNGTAAGAESAAGHELLGDDKRAKGRVLVKGRIAQALSLGQALAKAENVEINVDDLPTAQREVEQALTDNRLQPLVAKDLALAVQKRISEQTGGNVYYADHVRKGPIRQVQYVVLAAPEQISQLRSELDGLRARQRTPQIEMVSRVLHRTELSAKKPLEYEKAKRGDSGLAGTLKAAAPVATAEDVAAMGARSRPRKKAKPSEKRALRLPRPTSTMPPGQTPAGPMKLSEGLARDRRPATMASQLAQPVTRARKRRAPSSLPAAAPVHPLLITLNARMMKSAATAPASGRPSTTTSAPSRGKSDSPSTQPKGGQQSRPATAGADQ